MHARSALFDVYGDHLRDRGSQAPVAGLVRLLEPVGIQAPGGAHRDLADGRRRAGWSRCGCPPAAATAPPAARSGGWTRRRRGSTAASTRPGTATGSWRWSTRRVDRAARNRLRADLPSSGTAELAAQVWVSPFERAELDEVLRGPGRRARRVRADAIEPAPGRRVGPRRAGRGVPRLSWTTPTRCSGTVEHRRRPGPGGVRGPVPARARVAQVPLHRSRAARGAAAAPTGPGRRAAELFTERGRAAQAGRRPLRRALPATEASTGGRADCAHDVRTRAGRPHRRRRHRDAQPSRRDEQPRRRHQGGAARGRDHGRPRTPRCAASC